MTELIDPQLAAFEAQEPVGGPTVPAWYDNTVVELAGAIIAVRGLVALNLQRQGPPPIGDVPAVAQQAWFDQTSAWRALVVPALEQVYLAGRIEGLTTDELEAMATDYAAGLGDYLSETSTEALAEGFQVQLNDRWDASLAWHRAAAAYGTDRPGMRTYLRAVLAQPKGERDPIGTAARTLVDRLLVARADHVARTEAWTANQAGLATSWLIRQQRGELSARAMRRWRTRHRETVCAVCAPLDGQTVALSEPFQSVEGELWCPGAHPGCMCSQELVEPLSKSKKLDDGRLDPYDRDKGGRFAEREARTRDVTHLAVMDPAVQRILDELHEFQADTQTKPAEKVNPFIPAEETERPNPFLTPTSIFAKPEAKTNPFVEASNPFLDPESDRANPFLAPATTGVFSATKRPSKNQRSWTKPQDILHIVLVPLKQDKEELHRDYAPKTMRYEAWTNALEVPDGLVPVGKKFSFDQATASSFHQNYVNDLLIDQDEEDAAEASLSLDGATMVHNLIPPAIRVRFALEAKTTVDPWAQVPSLEERGYDDKGEDTWTGEIAPMARALWDEVIKNPAVAEKLTANEVKRIYEIAGYQQPERLDKAIQNIQHHCHRHGAGDDSLAEAFADYIVWNPKGRLGMEGVELDRRLDDADMPTMTDAWGTPPVEQLLTFENRLHPETILSEGDHTAHVEGTYTAHHVVYRSNLGEKGADGPAFTWGIREVSMWPAGEDGSPLYGGPYPDPPPWQV